jgi:hypothetical protein
VAHFTKLLVWEKSHALMVNTHRVAKGIRHAYDKSLQSQMNRAAESIATNIVEGRGKSSDAEFARFCVLRRVRRTSLSITSWLPATSKLSTSETPMT